MKTWIVLACLACAPLTLRAQDTRGSDTLVTRLKSPSSEARTRAAEDIYGAGIESAAVYEQLAANLRTGMEGLTKSSPQLEEMAWSVKALGSSGDLQYMPLIDAAIASDIGYLARHARGAKETLQEAAATGKPYLTYTKVRLITERQAESCQYVSESSCQTARAPEKCIESHKAKAVEAGANSVMVLFSSSQSGGLTLWGASTTMPASYYLCR